jgi:hypothetical protein
MSQASFQKRMREKARLDKARAKQARKQDRQAEAEAAAEAASQRDDPSPAPQTELLDELAALHQRFDADEIVFDEFEQRKHELLAQLDV